MTNENYICPMECPSEDRPYDEHGFTSRVLKYRNEILAPALSVLKASHLLSDYLHQEDRPYRR